MSKGLENLVKNPLVFPIVSYANITPNKKICWKTKSNHTNGKILLKYMSNVLLLMKLYTIEKSNFKTRFQWFDAFDQINTIEYRGMNVTKRSILENRVNSSWLEMTHQE